MISVSREKQSVMSCVKIFNWLSLARPIRLLRLHRLTMRRLTMRRRRALVTRLRALLLRLRLQLNLVILVSLKGINLLILILMLVLLRDTSLNRSTMPRPLFHLDTTLMLGLLSLVSYSTDEPFMWLPFLSCGYSFFHIVTYSFFHVVTYFLSYCYSFFLSDQHPTVPGYPYPQQQQYPTYPGYPQQPPPRF